jgi:hypothetical protein
MDYELRIVVEKVAVSSQEVVKRDTIASYALQCPTSILELGLRHGEQICLLAKIQDILLTEQSGLIDHETHVCPNCGNIPKKNGYKASDFHAVFSDHTLHIQKHHCSNPDCRWHSTPTIKSLWKRNKKVSMHPCPEHLCVQDTRKGSTVAPRGHQEVRAEQGVAYCGGDVDAHGHGSRGLCLCAHLVFLPPPRGQTDWQNSQPISCQDALPCAFGAVA